ncbi:MAG: trypsin-like peptidase domain-containing protein [Salibacteraceae bacterium]
MNLKAIKMKAKLGYLAASFIGGLMAIGAMTYYQDQRYDRLAEIESLRAEHLKNNNQLVNYSAPAMAVDFREAAQKTVNAVVHVKTSYELDGGYYTFDPIRHFFFGDGLYQKPPRIGAGAGSGVIISENGYIVTNNHVIDKASKVEIVMNNNKAFEAEVIGQDPSTDLALLKVDAKDLPKIQYGNSDQIQVGEWVLAVGNPFNLESTVTAGIVSAKGRDINILANGPDGMNAVESFIQTDAAVNPGNSGGALVNADGELVGINAAIKSNTGSYTGYSFAIPVNIVTKVVEDLLEYGAVQRGYLGVNIRNINQELADKEGLDDLGGIYVSETIDRGAAKDAGIVSGDIIVKVAEVEVDNVTELQEQISRFRPGDKVLVSVIRNGEPKEFPIILKNRFGEAEVSYKKELDLHQKLGALFSDIDESTKEKLGIDAGVRVTDIASGKMRSAGILEGFIITSIDEEKVSSKDHFFELLEAKSGGVLIEGVYPNGKRAYYGFGL